MEKAFKKLLGNRIYLDAPPESESKLIVDDNTKQALIKEMYKKMNKIRIHTVGSSITDPDIVEGTYILVDPATLSQAPLIPLSKDESVLMISIFDVIMVW